MKSVDAEDGLRVGFIHAGSHTVRGLLGQYITTETLLMLIVTPVLFLL